MQIKCMSKTRKIAEAHVPCGLLHRESGRGPDDLHAAAVLKLLAGPRRAPLTNWRPPSARGMPQHPTLNALKGEITRDRDVKAASWWVSTGMGRSRRRTGPNHQLRRSHRRQIGEQTTSRPAISWPQTGRPFPHDIKRGPAARGRPPVPDRLDVVGDGGDDGLGFRCRARDVRRRSP